MSSRLRPARPWLTALLLGSCSLVNWPDDARDPPADTTSGQGAAGAGTGGQGGQAGTPAFCGDGEVGGGEQCDGAGDTPECDSDCTEAQCGDGHRNAAAGEKCDDGGESAGCNADCTAAKCGDGVLNRTAGEECDDGDLGAGDACSPQCAVTPFAIEESVAPDVVGVTPSVGLAASGDKSAFVVAWRREQAEGSAVVFARLGATGKPLGPQPVELSSSAGAGGCDLAAHAEGRALAIWRQSSEQGDGLRYRPVDPAGVPVGDGDKLLAYAKPAGDVAVAATGGAEFCASWTEPGDGQAPVLAQCFDHLGTPLGGPAVTLGQAAQGLSPGRRVQRMWGKKGGFTVAWIDAASGQAVGRALSATGDPQGFAFGLSSLAGDTADPAGLGRGDNSLFAAFSVLGFHGKNEERPRVLLRRFTAPGSPAGEEVLVSTEHNSERASDLIAGSSGRFLLVWDSEDAERCAIKARVFAASGIPEGKPFEVSFAQAGQCDRFPRGVSNGQGDVLVAWAHRPAPGMRASVQAVLRPRLLAPAP